VYSKEDILAEADDIVAKIQSLDTVRDYHDVEQQIHNNVNIEARMKELKRNQKQSVNLQNYGKTEALKQSEGKISGIEQDINALPIVEEFRALQYEANDLLQMMISTMADQLNRLHENDDNK
jgi:cell fate (sporulation/competence/biofilm development) regulator YmcA (YheA/YmcA/DUF963 family)